jgi:hypothetical protein
METIIYDMDQFFKYADLTTLLSSILKKHQTVLNKRISLELKDTKRTIQKSLHIDSPFSSFCKKYGFSAIDLDILNAVMRLNTQIICPESYLKHSLLEDYNPSRVGLIISNLESSEIVKKGYVVLKDLFSRTSGNPQKDIFDIYNCPLIRKKSRKKFSVRFKERDYSGIDAI